MKPCIVTMKPTDSKWNNLPLSIEARKAAKQLMDTEPEKYPSMLIAIQAIRKEFIKQMNEEMEAIHTKVVEE